MMTTENPFPETTQGQIDEAMRDTTTLQDILPKDPDILTRDELHEKFMEVALRCFNKEKSLEMAMTLIDSYEKIIADQRDDIRQLLNELRKGFLTDWKKVDFIQSKYFDTPVAKES